MTRADRTPIYQRLDAALMLLFPLTPDPAAPARAPRAARR
jgi:hypothetical protein